MRESIKVKCGILENGMRFYSQYDSSKSTWLSGIGVRVGSIYDPPGKVGLAHIVEHFISCVSKKYPDQNQVDLILRRYLGGPDDDINIRTDRCSTFYGHWGLRKKDYMLKVFDIMASFVHAKYMMINSDIAKTELQAINNEYFLRGVDIMETLLDDEMHAVLYDKNPARNRKDCTLESLQSITVRDVRQFLRRYYVPKNMFVVVVGPPFQEVKQIAENYFGNWDDKSAPTFNYDESDMVPLFSSIKSKEVLREVGQYHCGIGFPTETYLSPDAEAIDILGHLWEIRLERLRDNAGIYRNPVEVERSFAHGIIWARFATKNREFEKYGEDVILEEAGRLRTDLVTGDELEAVVRKIEDDYLIAFSRGPDNLVEMIVDATCNGDQELTRLHSYLDRLRKVSRRLLRDVANKYFMENYARVLIKPA